MQKIDKEKRPKYISFAEELCKIALIKTSQEAFKEWLVNLMSSFKNNDVRILSDFYTNIMEFALSQKNDSKKLRAFQIARYFVVSFSNRARQLALNLLEQIRFTNFSDKKVCLTIQ